MIQAYLAPSSNKKLRKEDLEEIAPMVIYIFVDKISRVQAVLARIDSIKPSKTDTNRHIYYIYKAANIIPKFHKMYSNVLSAVSKFILFPNIYPGTIWPCCLALSDGEPPVPALSKAISLPFSKAFSGFWKNGFRRGWANGLERLFFGIRLALPPKGFFGFLMIHTCQGRRSVRSAGKGFEGPFGLLLFDWSLIFSL